MVSTPLWMYRPGGVLHKRTKHGTYIEEYNESSYAQVKNAMSYKELRKYGYRPITGQELEARKKIERKRRGF